MVLNVFKTPTVSDPEALEQNEIKITSTSTAPLTKCTGDTV